MAMMPMPPVVARMLAQARGQRLGAETVDAMDANVHFRAASGADGQPDAMPAGP